MAYSEHVLARSFPQVRLAKGIEILAEIVLLRLQSGNIIWGYISSVKVWVDLTFINRFSDARKEELFVFCSLFTLNSDETFFWIIG